MLDMTFFLNSKFLKSRLLLPSALKFSTMPETIYDLSSADSLVVAIFISYHHELVVHLGFSRVPRIHFIDSVNTWDLW